LVFSNQTEERSLLVIENEALDIGQPDRGDSFFPIDQLIEELTQDKADSE